MVNMHVSGCVVNLVKTHAVDSSSVYAVMHMNLEARAAEVASDFQKNVPLYLWHIRAFECRMLYIKSRTLVTDAALSSIVHIAGK